LVVLFENYNKYPPALAAPPANKTRYCSMCPIKFWWNSERVSNSYAFKDCVSMWLQPITILYI